MFYSRQMNVYEFICTGTVPKSNHTWPLLFLDCMPRADSQQDIKNWFMLEHHCTITLALF